MGCYTDSLRIKAVCLCCKPYHGAESSYHQANTSLKAKFGLVKNWHLYFCLVDMSHPQPRSSAPSARMRAQGHIMKPLRNKDDKFIKMTEEWNATALGRTGTNGTYMQLSCVHFPWPLHMSMQPSPM